MGRKLTEMEVGGDGVAIITIVNPPMNFLNHSVFWSLKDNYDEALKRDDVKAIVITSEGPHFSGGFDIEAFGNFQEIDEGIKPEPKEGYLAIDVLTDTFEGAAKPSVAAMKGLVIGGGLETAMACHARISTSDAHLALPELTVGFIPGLGGTQRLPRLVGLQKALDIILLSKPIGGEEAYNIGLVDAVVSTDELVKTAKCWALDIAEFRKPWIKSLHKADKLEPLEEVKKMLNSARSQARERSPHVHSPLDCIDVIEEGIISGPRNGLVKESNIFQKLLFSETCKNLIHVVLAQRRAAMVPGITDLGLIPRKITKIGVVGGNSMGSDIATALILKNYPVILKEVDENILNAGIDGVKENLHTFISQGKMTQEQCETALSLLTGLLDYECFKDVNMVIETVLEDLTSKQQVYADLQKYCSSDCILATNTSTFDLNLIGERTEAQDRIVGAHFFSPAYETPLLEIVQTCETSPQVIIDLLDIGEKIHKTPIAATNGSAVDRMFIPLTQTALFLVDHGLDAYKVDEACTKFGMPMGPFRLIDLVGIGVAIASSTKYLESFPDRFYKSRLMQIMLDDKREGKANGNGFYKYDEKKEAIPDPEIVKYINNSKNMISVTPNPQLRTTIPDEDIVEMLFFPVINEACRVLDKRIAVKPSDLDIASIMGIGFPAHRGGVIHWADSLGANYVCKRLEEWTKVYGELFFKPCAFLRERAGKGIPLSA
ncbi:peroxisomal fatty acid beta-oxidation multifunctional protein MFP2-like isoform X1 [Zingiber officinale]|nr:peroxisomal fatty acid beta-oxidation multifunctional protein MFP2-like isoform X1 [Zingiber officinale]